MNRFDQGFQDAVALVTGGGSGIGEATARRLAHEGARVVVADLDEARGKSVCEEIGAEFMPFDVSDPDAWEARVGEIESRYGALHIVHLNAVVTTYKSESGDLVEAFDLAAMPLASYRRIMGANVDGVILGARACARLIEASGGGCLVATASVAGVVSFPPDPVYTATKHAVVGFVRAQAPLLEPTGVMLHAVLPGVVDTNILSENFAAEARALGIKVMDPSEIAEGVVTACRATNSGGLWLCLPEQAPRLYEFAPVDNIGLPDLDE
ncbi:MAG: SDR family NAD(P)-dependent oxidoreductase [Myxococcota bacterium]|nr:SDR family NAD(P)-dependent oxidoreductase [Myxococcota bacterium]